ncbi:hypothetical protein [Verminephrobacter aporrectodeae]|uniref:hypothetical protein n=2 Tax=Verminephrobacter aporrectodeae TaxID=1110389 RepID=UPI0022386F6C|nr:hypothetical protein [Verminephrobacter aporrectodeae]
MTVPVFDLHAGIVPVLISIPHLGRIIPEEIRPSLTDEAFIVSDTDWHLENLPATPARVCMRAHPLPARPHDLSARARPRHFQLPQHRL